MVAFELELKENLTSVIFCIALLKNLLFVGCLVYVDMKRMWLHVAGSQISNRRCWQSMFISSWYLSLGVSLPQHKYVTKRDVEFQFNSV